MIYTYQHAPFFREAEQNGLIGPRGYFGYFEDALTGFMSQIGKDNFTLYNRYRAAWVFLRYRMHFDAEAGYDGALTIDTWNENHPSRRTQWIDTAISLDGRQMATGRVESCIFDLDAQQPVVLDRVEYPRDQQQDMPSLELAFTRLPKKTQGMQQCFTRTVRYCDLDTSRHMNNLLYINLFLDAFDMAFYDQWRVDDMELHFVNQCKEGEDVCVWEAPAEDDDRRHILLATRTDGALAAQCALHVVER